MRIAFGWEDGRKKEKGDYVGCHEGISKEIKGVFWVFGERKAGAGGKREKKKG